MLSWIFNNIALLIEIVAVVFGVIYVVLAAKNKISCWIYGIIGSLISIYLFIVYAKLYAEAVLYVFYVFAGIYGWITWKNTKHENEVTQHKFLNHVVIIGVGVVLALLLFYIVNLFFPKAQRPLIDSFTTVFSFIATYLTAKKWIENWLYWIVIDAVTVYLYFSRGLNIYALLMLAYSVIAIFGYLEWKKLKVVKVD
jgi:nicotinamide mononucleotide transporter